MARITPPFCGRHSAQMPRGHLLSALGRPGSRRVAASDLDQVWKAETRSLGKPRRRFRALESLPVSAPRVHSLRLARTPRGAAGAHPARGQRRHLVEQCVFHDLQQLVFHDRRAPRALSQWFINGLAATAPALFLYGADHLNSSVNSIRCRRVRRKAGGRARARPASS